MRDSACNLVLWILAIFLPVYSRVKFWFKVVLKWFIQLINKAAWFILMFKHQVVGIIDGRFLTFWIPRFVLFSAPAFAFAFVSVCCFLFVANLSLNAELRDLVLSRHPQHGHHIASHLMNIAQIWHLFWPLTYRPEPSIGLPALWRRHRPLQAIEPVVEHNI